MVLVWNDFNFLEEGGWGWRQNKEERKNKFFHQCSGVFAGSIFRRAKGVLKKNLLQRHRHIDVRGKLRGKWKVLKYMTAAVVIAMLSLLNQSYVQWLPFSTGVFWDAHSRWVSTGIGEAEQYSMQIRFQWNFARLSELSPGDSAVPALRDRTKLKAWRGPSHVITEAGVTGKRVVG